MFEPVAYPTSGAAIDALRNEEVDCVFPSNLGTSDGETLGLIMTPAVMSSDIYAVVRSSNRDSFSSKTQVTVAIEENDPNYDSLMLDHFPSWQAEAYPDMEKCFTAVSNGRADCILISNYQYNALSELIDQYDMTTLATGENVDFFFAVNRGDNALYSILTRTTNLVSDTTVNAALNYYSYSENTITLGDFIRQNPTLVVAVGLVILALIVIIIIQRRLIDAQRKAKESQHQVEDLSKQVYVDALTHVRNKGGFDNYIGQLQARLEQGELLEFAVGVFDCDDLKGVNDRFGHEKGNIYLMASCRAICRVFQHSPVFRVGGDEFVVVLMGDDYETRDNLLRKFEEEQKTVSAAAKNQWERVSVASGVAVYDPVIDQTMRDLMDRADQLMYESKRLHKEARQKQN